MPNRKLRVFLCHASQDKPIVRELYQRLLAEGWIDPWVDEENLLPGQDWDMEIEKAVEVADVVIVCLSAHAVTKDGYIQKELRFALSVALTKLEDEIFIIPLRLDNCQPPRRLQSWQYADYFPSESRNKAYNRLLDSLTTRANSKNIKRNNSLEESYGGFSHSELVDRSKAEVKNASSAVRVEEENVSEKDRLPLQTGILKGHDKQINGLVFSPDSKYLISGGGGFWDSGSKQLTLWDFAQNQNRTYERMTSTTWCVDFSPNGKIFATGSGSDVVSGNYRIRLWSIEGKKIFEFSGHSNTVRRLSFLNGGSLLGSFDDSGTLILWDTIGGGFVRSTKFNNADNAVSAFLPESNSLAIHGGKGILIWDIANRREIKTIQHEKLVEGSSLAFTHDGNFLMMGSKSNGIYVLDVNEGKITQKLGVHAKSVDCLAVSSDNRYLASGSKDHSVCLWSLKSGNLIHKFSDHTGGVNSVAFSPDGKFLASGSNDQTIRVLRLSLGLS